jgi:hypothetical protein
MRNFLYVASLNLYRIYMPLSNKFLRRVKRNDDDDDDDDDDDNNNNNNNNNNNK